MGTILYLTQPLFFFPLFQFLWLQRANTGFGLAEGAAEFLAGTIIVGGLAILVHSQPGRAGRYWRPASCHLTWCRFFMSAVASKWSVFLDYYKNLGLCARAENQKRTEQIFCCTVKMSVASKRRHDHAFLKHVFAEKQLLQGRKNANPINLSAWSAMNKGMFSTSSSSFRLSRENRTRSLTWSGNSSLNFLRLLLVVLASDLTSTGKMSFSRWMRKSTS